MQRLRSLGGRREFTVSIPLRSLSHAYLWKHERRQWLEAAANSRQRYWEDSQKYPPPWLHQAVASSYKLSSK